MNNNLGIARNCQHNLVCVLYIFFLFTFLSCSKNSSQTNPDYQRKQQLLDLIITGSFYEYSDIDTNDDWSFPYILQGSGAGNGANSNSAINMNLDFMQTFRKDGLLYFKINLAETSNIGNSLILENFNINFSTLPFVNGIAIYEGILNVFRGSGKYAFQGGQEFKISGTIDRNTNKIQMRLTGIVLL